MKKFFESIGRAIVKFFNDQVFSTYDLYFYKELMPNYLFGLAFFTTIIMLNELFFLAKYYFEYNVPFDQVMLLLLTLLPFLLSFSIPFAILPAYLLTMGRFSQDSEIIALKACGISTVRILRPGIIFGVFITIFALLFKNYVEMPANYNYVQTKARVMAQKPAIEFKEKSFLEVGNYKITFDRMETVNNVDILYNLYVVDLGGRKVIQAEKGRFYSNPENPEQYILKFLNGSISEVVTSQEDGKTVEHSFYVSFDYLALNAFIELPDEYYSKGPEMMTIKELRDDIHADEGNSLTRLNEMKLRLRTYQSNLTAITRKYRQDLIGKTGEEREALKNNYTIRRNILTGHIRNKKIEMDALWKSLPIYKMVKYQDKFAMPIASIVFALLSLSIGMYTARSGRGEGLGISVIIMLMYYGSKVAMENMMTKLYLSPMLTWLPNIVFLVAGIILFANKVKK